MTASIISKIKEIPAQATAAPVVLVSGVDASILSGTTVNYNWLYLAALAIIAAIIVFLIFYK